MNPLLRFALPLCVAALSTVHAQEKTFDLSDRIDSPKRQTALGLQLFLDREGFGPGRLDAWWGEFTSKAGIRWNEANPDKPIPLDKKGEPKKGAHKELGWSKPLTVVYTITEADQAQVGTLPDGPEEMAKQKSLPYATLLELISEKFHCFPELIGELNGIGPDADLSVGQKLKVPNVERPFDAGSVEKRIAERSGDGSVEIRILRNAEILEVYEKGRIVHSFPVTPGSERIPAPAGDWKIDVVAWMPEFRYDKQMLEEGRRSENAHLLPPGPNNPVGIVWMGINKDGIGIHGTAEPDAIGRNASSGCVRLSNWDALVVGEKIGVGTKVRIE